jgi:hypothetical protein
VAGAFPNLSVSGATGSNDFHFNGIWDRSAEVVAGQSVYFKKDDADRCLEYYAPKVNRL